MHNAPHSGQTNPVAREPESVSLLNPTTNDMPSSMAAFSPPTTPFMTQTSSSGAPSMYHRTSNVREIRNQKKLTTTLIIILCLLLVCHLPSFLFEESLADAIFGSHESAEITPQSVKAFKIKAIGNRISILLIYLNCSCNFLIYCICNKKFKNSLKILFRKSCLNGLFDRACFFLSTHCCALFCYAKNRQPRQHHIVRYSISDPARLGIYVGSCDEPGQPRSNLTSSSTMRSSMRSTTTLTLSSIKSMNIFRKVAQNSANSNSGGVGGSGAAIINLGKGSVLNGPGYRKASVNTINTVNSTKLSESVVNYAFLNQR
jgi:hypothetical protein